MRLFILCFALTGLVACTSLMTGAGGTRAGAPIGTDSRGAATVTRDDQISRTIRDRFAADGDLAAAGLRVDTRRGVVTLRGSLATFELRDRALRLARDVSGVVRVSSQITVRR